MQPAILPHNPTYRTWLLDQIIDCLDLVDHDPARYLRLVLALACLYAEWSE